MWVASIAKNMQDWSLKSSWVEEGKQTTSNKVVAFRLQNSQRWLLRPQNCHITLLSANQVDIKWCIKRWRICSSLSLLTLPSPWCYLMLVTTGLLTVHVDMFRCFSDRMLAPSNALHYIHGIQVIAQGIQCKYALLAKTSNRTWITQGDIITTKANWIIPNHILKQIPSPKQTYLAHRPHHSMRQSKAYKNRSLLHYTWLGTPNGKIYTAQTNLEPC